MLPKITLEGVTLEGVGVRLANAGEQAAIQMGRHWLTKVDGAVCNNARFEASQLALDTRRSHGVVHSTGRCRWRRGVQLRKQFTITSIVRTRVE